MSHNTLTNLPLWLSPNTDKQQLSATDVAHTLRQYELLLPLVLEAISNGTHMKDVTAEYDIDYKPYLTWILRNINRRAAYYEAQAVHAEHLMMTITDIADGKNADGTNSMEDVARSKLRITTRQWLMEIANRSRFSTAKTLDRSEPIVDTSAQQATQHQIKDVVGKLLDQY